MNKRSARSLYYVFSSGPVKVERGVWRPNTDICETETHVIVSLEVAGVLPEDINIMQYADRIVVRGVRRPEVEPGPKRYHQIEIVCGEFEKEIVLSGPLRGAPVEAALSLGVLSLRISKEAALEAAVERSIPIEAQ